MEGLTQPTLLLKPFAQNGTKNTIPVTNTDTTNPQKADLTNGFPAITSLSPDDGGLPAERADFNGLGYLTTTYDYFYQAGGTYTFNQTVSTAIGGYPLGARLWYTDSNGVTAILRSTKNNNDDNFVTTPSYIGTSWVKDTPTTSDISTIISTIYPVGSIYIGTQATCPLATLIAGSSWEQIQGRYLLASGNLVGTSESYSATNTVAAGLPQHTHFAVNTDTSSDNPPTSSTSIVKNSAGGLGNGDYVLCKSSTTPTVGKTSGASNSLYGQSDTVRAPAYAVNVWRRTA